MEWIGNILVQNVEMYFNWEQSSLLWSFRSIFTKDVEAAALRDELLLARKRELELVPQLLEWNELENQKTKELR